MTVPRITKLLTHKAFRNLLFCGSLMLLIWPMLGTTLQSRIDHLFVYLYAVWGVLILLLLAVSRAEQKSGAGSSTTGERE